MVQTVRWVTSRVRAVPSALVVMVLCAGMLASGLPSAGAQSNGKGKAKGEPIVIGTYTPADNPTFTAPELIDGERAAVSYVNNDLNGVGGRPLKLVSCKSDYTAPGLTACANKLFQADPLIIIPGPDAAAFSVQPVFNDSGVPLIGGASFTPPEYTSPSRAVFNGFSASLFPAMIHFAVDKFDAKKLTIMALDIQSNSIIESIFFDPVAENYGLPKPEYVPVPTGSADMTSSIAAALDTNPDVLLPFGLPCLPFYQAYQSLGSDVPVILPDNCSDTKTLKRAGSQAEGMHYVSLFNGPAVAPKDKDVRIYSQQMKKYAKNAPDTDFSRAGFGSIMNIHDLLDDQDPSTLTHESVLTAFKGASDQANFLNTPYDCVAPPVADYPAICAGSAFLMQQKNGKLKRESKFVTLDVLFNEPTG
jgi:branched-chain amino acid transport system substrate-binding protein